MYFSNKKGLFERFFENRSFLIAQLENGDLTKSQFLRENFEYLERIGAKPFLRVDSMEKGMFNYQYFNIMAKYYRSVSEEIFRKNKHPKYALSLRQKSDDMYHKKNLSILQMLRLKDYRNVDAYFIHAKSSKLNGHLFEVVFYDVPQAIFHSTANWLLDHLREHDCFLAGKYKSLIDHYINEKY